MKVGIINYGVGNLGSVARALKELKAAPVFVDRPNDMHSSDALILPGVGSFAESMKLLHEGGWIEALHAEVLTHGKPLLGVCLGMHLLADSGMEGVFDGGNVKGLGFVPGKVEHLSTIGCALRLPHVGWNTIHHTQPVGHLLANIPDETDFYFVHSYVFCPKEEESILATAHYGVPFPVIVHKGNVWGTQFHPEKSSRAGFTILRNFIEGYSC